MKITNIKQQQRDENRVSIYIDEKYSFSLNLNELLDEKLKVGLEIDQSQIDVLKKKSAEGKLRMRSLEWLLNRPHSEREFRDYLRRKKAEPDLIEGLIAQFQERGVQDDVKYAEWLFAVRLGRGKSLRAIQAELRAKGVADSIVQEVVRAQPIDEAEQLQEIIAKKRRLSRYKDDQKLLTYLARQGFGFDDIKTALNVEALEDGE